MLSSLFSGVMSLIANLLAVYTIDPKEMGIIQSALLIPTYMAFLHCGVFNGAGRAIPIAVSQGKYHGVQKIFDSSWYVAKLMVWIGVVASMVIFLYVCKFGVNSIYYYSVFLVLIMLISEPISQVYDITFIGTRDFKNLVHALLWQNIVNTVIAVLPLANGLIGFIFGRSFFYATKAIVRHYFSQIKNCGEMSKQEIYHLGKSGLPLLLAGSLYHIFQLSDRSLAAFLLDKQAIGELSVANVVATGFLLVQQSVLTVLYPRVLNCYGEFGISKALNTCLLHVITVSALVQIPIAIIAYILLDKVILSFLPLYVGGLSAAKIAALGSCSLVLMSPSLVLAAIGNSKKYIFAIGLSTLTMWLSPWLFKDGDCTLNRIVLLKNAVLFLLGLFTSVYSFWVIRIK